MRPKEPTFYPDIVHAHGRTDMNSSREDSEERRQEEEQRMREPYEQSEDLQDEIWEQRRRRIEEERKRKEQDWEVKWMKEEEEERERKGYEEWKRKREENDGPWRRWKEEEKRKKEVIEPAYEKLQTEVKKYDDGMVVGWKEDIDTLLVFAGLFSAIVTAFLIESYQWLQEDPEDATVVILTQIFHQLNASSIPKPEPFTPDASSIRINCFWFLSLIFSLTSALFGLLCKQWLREHQRDVPTRTVAENLALRQLRRDSFEKWGVASFLSALPILLEIALVFFFIGVLDLLWTLHPVVFGICLAAISLSIGLYFLTTILPTITIPRDQAQFISTWESELKNWHHDFGQLAYQFICPYKSPQAWAVYKLVTTLPKPLLHFPFINDFTKTHLRPLWDHVHARTSSWSTFDLRVVRQFDQKVYPMLGISFQLQVYELQALQWAVTMFRDSPSMIPHLENVLETLPRSVAISAVLDRWDIAMWGVQEEDVGECLRYPTMTPMPKPITSDPPLHSREGIKLLFWHRLWAFCAESYPNFPDVLQNDLLRELEQNIFSGVLTLSKTLKFPIPLPFATALWSHKEPLLQKLGLRLLRHFEESWKPSPGYDEEQHNKERVAFTNGLAWHICHLDPPSVLLMSKRGQDFIRFIHHGIIIRRLYSRDDFWGYSWRPISWQYAIKKVQEVGKLPDDYFAPLPRYDEDPPPSFQLPQLEPIRYSQDTICSQSDNPQNEDGERPPTPTGSVEKIEIQVHGSHGNTASRVSSLAGGTPIDPGGSGTHPVNENSALPPDSDDRATVGTIAGGINPGGDEQVIASKGVARGSPIPLSAGYNESAVLREDVPPNTDQGHLAEATDGDVQAVSSLLEGAKDKHRSEVIDENSDFKRSGKDADASGHYNNPDHPQEPAMDTMEGSSGPLVAGGDELGVLRSFISPDTNLDHPAQANEDPARVPSELEEQGKRVREDHEEQAEVGVGGGTAPSSSRDRGRRRDEGRGSTTINDPNHLRMFRL
ncbi:hypothetical protein VNI00_014230 [Paramarasmius palmivorus]|uniref:DUF6535 domain-containing protein n=1 Tax=Paramarasmius palmivorus TaxID=297713 RepID=A0AAW0BWD5_9AGAR